MPLPINLISRNPSEENPKNNNLLDVSFLASNLHQQKEASDYSFGLSDRDASHVMNIWLHGKKIGKDQFDLSDVDIDNKDVLRLKTRGLISGGTKEIKITNKGKSVVKTMALGESNKFLNNRKEKSYTEILASMDKRGKRGYRIAGIYDENSHLINLTAGSDLDDASDINRLMQDIRSHFNTGSIQQSDLFSSYEMMDEAMGTAWINVFYDIPSRKIVIDKYYENELLDEEMSRNASVPFNSENYEETKNNVIKTIESFK
jgi:hypothetical protein